MHSSHSGGHKAKSATPAKGGHYLIFSLYFISLKPFSPTKSRAWPALRSSGPVPFHSAARPAPTRRISADAPDTRLTCERRVRCCGGSGRHAANPTRRRRSGGATQVRGLRPDFRGGSGCTNPARQPAGNPAYPPRWHSDGPARAGHGRKRQACGKVLPAGRQRRCARITDAGAGSFRPCGAALERADRSAKKKERAQGPLFPQIISDQIRTTS